MVDDDLAHDEELGTDWTEKLMMIGATQRQLRIVSRKFDESPSRQDIGKHGNQCGSNPPDDDTSTPNESLPHGTVLESVSGL